MRVNSDNILTETAAVKINKNGFTEVFQTSAISSKISIGTKRQVFFFSIPLSFETVRNFFRQRSSATSDRLRPKNRIPRIRQTSSAKDLGQTTAVPYMMRWRVGWSVVCISRQTWIGQHRGHCEQIRLSRW